VVLAEAEASLDGDVAADPASTTDIFNTGGAAGTDADVNSSATLYAGRAQEADVQGKAAGYFLNDEMENIEMGQDDIGDGDTENNNEGQAENTKAENSITAAAMSSATQRRDTWRGTQTQAETLRHHKEVRCGQPRDPQAARQMLDSCANRLHEAACAGEKCSEERCRTWAIELAHIEASVSPFRHHTGVQAMLEEARDCFNASAEDPDTAPECDDEDVDDGEWISFLDGDDLAALAAVSRRHVAVAATHTLHSACCTDTELQGSGDSPGPSAEEDTRKAATSKRMNETSRKPRRTVE
jgi:hypothetical protein